MTWALTVLFIQLIANARDPHRFVSIMPEPPGPWLAVSLVVFFVSVLASRRSMLFLWSRLQRHTVR